MLGREDKREGGYFSWFGLAPLTYTLFQSSTSVIRSNLSYYFYQPAQLIHFFNGNYRWQRVHECVDVISFGPIGNVYSINPVRPPLRGVTNTPNPNSFSIGTILNVLDHEEGS
jgi:hypothetical protein